MMENLTEKVARVRPSFIEFRTLTRKGVVKGMAVRIRLTRLGLKRTLLSFVAATQNRHVMESSGNIGVL